MYKIGFFYNLSGEYSLKLVLYFNGEHFTFLTIESNNLPRRYQHLTKEYQSFNMPVILKLDDTSSEIIDIYFLEDLPKQPESIKGCPFSLQVNDYYITSELLFKNKPIGENFGFNERENSLLRLVVRFATSKKRIYELQKLIKSIYPGEIGLDVEIKFLLDQVNSVDLNAILSKLYVEVIQYYGYSRAKEDYVYNIYRTARIEDESMSLDGYLKELLGIGEHVVIYENYGYKCNEEKESLEFSSVFPEGVYKGRVLQKEKRRIISAYSKEAHVASLCYDKMSEIIHYENLSKQWSNNLDMSLSSLEEFINNKLFSIDGYIFYEIQQNKTPELLTKLNKYIYRLQTLADYRVAIVGSTYLRDKDKAGCYKKIEELISKLIDNYNVEIIMSDHFLNGPLQEARAYAKNNILEYRIYHRYHDPNIEECISWILNNSDHIYIIGDVDSKIDKLIDKSQKLNIITEVVKL